MASITATYSPITELVEITIEPKVLCRLCLANVSKNEMFEMDECKCEFCRECIKQYVDFCISDGCAIACPDSLCEHNGYVTTDEVELDPLRTWCPAVDCETVCCVCSKNKTKPTPVTCPTCSLEFCSICKTSWHPGKDCKSSLLLDNERLPFMTRAEDAAVKRCPMCYVPIERNDGCAQMMCKRCKHVFCWYCLASLDDDFLLRHFDSGPCKNKLGHSRASVIWHRTQVIGIFAGFGVLLLIASPFLLLAAPCLLFCKCKSKCCAKTNEGVDGLP